MDAREFADVVSSRVEGGMSEDGERLLEYLGLDVQRLVAEAVAGERGEVIDLVERYLIWAGAGECADVVLSRLLVELRRRAGDE